MHCLRVALFSMVCGCRMLQSVESASTAVGCLCCVAACAGLHARVAQGCCFVSVSECPAFARQCLQLLSVAVFFGQECCSGECKVRGM
jgi:hypothetical protein